MRLQSKRKVKKRGVGGASALATATLFSTPFDLSRPFLTSVSSLPGEHKILSRT